MHEVCAIVAEQGKVRPLSTATVETWSGACTEDRRVAADQSSPVAMIDPARDALGSRREDAESSYS
ncbi:hypothetical protein A7982_13293 [Minicystis rosea]|nr:hypothetical protein A7982_13293 [Minicystis rosea]